MILAAIEGQLLLLVLMAVFGFISWVSKKFTGGSEPPSPSAPPTARRESPTRRAPADTEEERMRRFLEALGLPADHAPPKKPVPQMRPDLPQLPATPAAPRPRPVAAPEPPRRSAAPPPLLPVPTRAPEARPEPARVAERMKEHDLVTAQRRDFETVTSRISAAGTAGGREAAPLDPYRGRDLSTLSPAAALRIALSSQQQLRAAFLLREVIGPPIALRK